jgi:HAD superfamily hydrolase (TIGR01458 family)
MKVGGVLLDLEGVLYTADRPIDGAVAAVHALGDAGLSLRFLTNTTTQPRRAIVERLLGMGIEIEIAQMFTPAIAARTYLAAEGLQRLHLTCPPSLAEDFPGFTFDDERPQAVVMGDLYRGFDWDRLNTAFQKLVEGARLIALHKNRYTHREAEGLSLDLGPFVAALEYAAEQAAVVVGKPSETFFAMALRDMNLPPEDVVMVGDDIGSDIGGGIAAGLRTIQVRTGKYRERDAERTDIVPDCRIDSIGDLPDLLAR